MLLKYCEPKDEYIITQIDKTIEKRFLSYGFFVGEKIFIHTKDKRMMIVETAGTIYAINEKISSKIEVGIKNEK